MSEPRPLHRLFGLSWIDFFQGSPVGVETELDLSLKQQFVDVVLIRKGPGPVPRRLPDGFEELAAHNLVTFKELPRAEHNAMLLLFSAREELLQYAREHYQPHSPETSTLLYELFKAYSEDLTMADKLKEFVRQSIDELLKSLRPEERLKGLSPEERLKGLSADEVARALPPETLEELARRFKANGSSPKQ
jgi:hypothetical protein